jgi:hypothetical protein
MNYNPKCGNKDIEKPSNADYEGNPDLRIVLTI